MTQDQQDAIVRKVKQMCANFHRRRMQVAKYEMNGTRCTELCDEEVEELRQMLKGQE